MTIPYAGLGLDRATDRRADPAWVAALAAGGQAQVWPFWREIVEARWFTRAELRQYEQARGQLGRVDSVDRVLLAAWLAEGDQSTPTRA